MMQEMPGPGSPQPMGPNTGQEVYCFSCGQKIMALPQICPHCGVPQKPTVVSGGGGGIALIIVVVVVVMFLIIGILAAIAIPNFISYRQRSYDAAANADAKNCYTASQAYFTDNPDGSVDLSWAKEYGFTQTTNVDVDVEGTQDTLFIRSSHQKGNKEYQVDPSGAIFY